MELGELIEKLREHLNSPEPLQGYESLSVIFDGRSVVEQIEIIK